MTHRILFGLVVLSAISFSRLPRFWRIGTDDGLPQAYVRQITQDKRGYLWVGTQDGLARFDGRRFEVHRTSPNDLHSIAGNNLDTLFIGNDSALYAGVNRTVCRYDPAKNAWHSLTPRGTVRQLYPCGLQQVHDGVTNVRYVDQKGRIWTASVRNGLHVSDAVDEAAGRTVRFSIQESVDPQFASSDVWKLEDNDCRNPMNYCRAVFATSCRWNTTIGRENGGRAEMGR